MKYLKTYEGSFLKKVFGKKINDIKDPEVVKKEAELTEEEKKAKAEILADKLLEILSKRYNNIKKYHVYVSNYIKDLSTISYSYYDNIENQSKRHNQSTEARDLKIYLNFNIDINCDPDNIEIKSFRIKSESILPWTYNEHHESFFYQRDGSYRIGLNRSYPNWKFDTESDEKKYYPSSNSYHDDLGWQIYYILLEYVDDTVKNHLKFIFDYCGVDTHNKLALSKLENVKEQLDDVKYCLMDLIDLSNKHEIDIIPLGKDSKGRIVSKKIFIQGKFDIVNLGVFSLGASDRGLSFVLNNKLLSIFDCLAEAKPRILDLLPGANFEFVVAPYRPGNIDACTKIEFLIGIDI